MKLYKFSCMIDDGGMVLIQKDHIVCAKNIPQAYEILHRLYKESYQEYGYYVSSVKTIVPCPGMVLM